MAGPGPADGPARSGRPGRRPSPEALRVAAAAHAAGFADSPEGWYRLLAAAAVNLHLGFTSAVLVDAAGSGPVPAASYDAWRAAGWRIPRGQKARVWVIAGQDGGPPEVARVFTAGQVKPARTRGSPVPPGGSLSGPVPAERAFGALAALARRLDYRLDVPATAAGAYTDWDERAVIIPGGLPAAAQAGALARELAFVVAAGDLPRPPGQTTAGAYGAAAARAGSAAWLALTRLGVDPAGAGLVLPPARAWAGTDPRSPPGEFMLALGEQAVQDVRVISGHAEKVLARLPPPPPARPAPRAARTRAGRARPPVPAPAPPVPPAPAAVPVPLYGRYQPPAGAAVVQVAARPDWPCPDQALVRVNMAAAAFYRSRLPGSWAEGYLQGRGFGPEVCRRWQLGYAPLGRTILLVHLRRAGFTDQVIEQAGLATRAGPGSLVDYFRDRVIIPVRGPHGQVAGFAGRCAPADEGAKPKYVNTPATALYRKKELLYGLPEAAAALAAGARPVRVEGYFDVIAVTTAAGPAMAGVTGGGTALTAEQMQLLAAGCDLDRVPLLDACDQDRAGQAAAARDYLVIAPYCPAAGAVPLPAKDPALVFEQDGPAALAAALSAGEHPLADVAVDAVLAPWQEHLDKEWAAGQLAAVRAAARLFADVPPAAADMVRQVLRVADRTGIPHWEVAGEFAAAAAAGPRPKDPGRPGPAAPRVPGGPSPDFPAGPVAARPRVPGRPARAGRPGTRGPAPGR